MLAASLAFYASWNVIFVFVPLFVCVVVYLSSQWMLASPGKARQWMWLGISLTLAVLVFFKCQYAGQDGRSTAHACTSDCTSSGHFVYTFEAIGHLIDARQGRIRKTRFMDLCLFFLFWPNIMAGPIVRVRELVPQLKFKLEFEPRFAFGGLDRLIWGLVQKNVIANTLSLWVDKGFASRGFSTPSTLDAWFLAVAFGLQIYFDFAGYSNMAIGAARLLGVTLPENFREPYHAATPPEFWARWHMTLSRWIRDYLFFPINAKYMGAPLPLYLSLISVMALVGLWHGAGWTFILWGAMHGTYLVLFRLYESTRRGQQVLQSHGLLLAGGDYSLSSRSLQRGCHFGHRAFTTLAPYFHPCSSALLQE